MTLAAGTRLGSYEILAPLGAGGMGEVYRARDAKLNRDVAIKVLPEAVAEDAERLARFQREAQVLASLNHPHIAAIYGLEKTGSVEALVLELVEGETLAERIASGPLPLDEALAIARQIADALEGAHEKGIVHRDLKPANVKITPQGKVKVLDFGLAKALTGDRSSPDQTRSPTLTAAATQAGVVIGTAAYMSPEQARGKSVDKRADIWAFGAVLYEMLAGRKAFEGETVSDTLAAVLRADIDWNALPRETPSAVRRVLRRCLDRDAKTRFHDVADARIEMDEAPEPAAQTPLAAPPAKRSRLWPIATAVALALAALGWWKALGPESAPPPLAARLSLILPAGDRLPYGDNPVFALSRDGRQLVYVAERESSSGLSLRALDATNPKPIEGTSNAVAPFFSPDGRWIGFFADGKLKKVSLGGGKPIPLADVSSPRGGAWLEDDTIVYCPEYSSGLWRVAARGGKAEILTKPDIPGGERTHRWPAPLPGGKEVVFTVGLASSPSDYDGAGIAVLDVASRKVRRVFEGGSMPQYVPPGRLVFLRGSSVLAVPFDPDRPVVAEALPVIESVGGDLTGGAGYYATAPDGTLLYASGGMALPDRTLVIVNRKGAAIDVPLSPRQFLAPRFSPDGKRLAFSVGAGSGADDDVWIYDLAGKLLTRLTFGGTGLAPVWSPDGTRIAYGSIRGGGEGIWVKAADGSGRDEQLDSIPRGAETPVAWTADGILGIMRLSPTVGAWLLPLGGKEKAREVHSGTPLACFSPDGRWIVYQTGTPSDLFVAPTDGSPGKWQITTDRGDWPVWAGNEIFYVRQGGDVWAVDVETRPTFRAGAPRLVYRGEGRYDVRTLLPPFDASPDGQRFVLLKSSGRTDAANRIDVVLNWPAELQRIAPLGEK